MQFCFRCGHRVFPDARFCTSCGEQIDFPTSNVYVFSLAEDDQNPNYPIDFFEVDLVGESRFEEQFAEILGDVDDDEENEMDDVVAVLVREPDNPLRPHAVSVYAWDGEAAYRQVGYLSSKDVSEYAETIQELERRTGRLVGCLARVHAQGPTEISECPIYSARVYLPDAENWLQWRI